MKMDHEKAKFGNYVGLTDWLKAEVGKEGVDWEFVPCKTMPERISHICIHDPAKELLALLKWG